MALRKRRYLVLFSRTDVLSLTLTACDQPTAARAPATESKIRQYNPVARSLSPELKAQKLKEARELADDGMKWYVFNKPGRDETRKSAAAAAVP